MDDDLGPLRESQEIAIFRRSVPRSVFAVRLLSAFIYFLAQRMSDLKSSSRFEI